MVWLAVTRPDIPRLIVSAAITSTKRAWSSSVSSQWMSIRRPNSSARSKASCTDATPSSRVSSKCGMPPTTSAPSSIASRIRPAPPSKP